MTAIRVSGIAERLRASAAVPRQWVRNRGHLRILIAGAPKCGNMWLRMLLGGMYDLTQMDITGILRAADYPRRGSFVTHQHVWPVAELFAWGDPTGIRYITMIRHPGDVLLSLYHYVNTIAQQLQAEGRLGEARSHSLIGQALDSGPMREYVRDHFGHECLHLSTAWVRSNRAEIVRYEDLHLMPEYTLDRLALKLGRVPRERVRRAVDSCSLVNLRRVAGPNMRDHFRKGRMDEWRTRLPRGICDLVAERYADELRLLRYSFENG